MDLLILLIPLHCCLHDDDILPLKHVGWLKFIYNIGIILLFTYVGVYGWLQAQYM